MKGKEKPLDSKPTLLSKAMAVTLGAILVDKEKSTSSTTISTEMLGKQVPLIEPVISVTLSELPPVDPNDSVASALVITADFGALEGLVLIKATCLDGFFGELVSPEDPTYFSLPVEIGFGHPIVPLPSYDLLTGYRAPRSMSYDIQGIVLDYSGEPIACFIQPNLPIQVE